MSSPKVGSSPRSWLVVGLWFALALATLRLAVLFGMERMSHDTTLSFVRVRLGLAVPSVVLSALVVALPFGFLAGASVRGGRVRWMQLSLVVLIFGGLSFVLLAGWWGADSTRRVGLQTDNGVKAAKALAAVAGATCFFFGWLAVRLRARRTGLIPVALPAFVLGGAGVLAGPLLSDFSEDMPVEQVLVELLASEGAWSASVQREDAPVAVGPLSPSIDYQVDGGDMPALLMAPPARVDVNLDELDQPLWLQARAGVDLEAMSAHEETLEGHSIRFRVSRGAEVLFDERIAFGRVGRFPGTEWISVGGEEGIPVLPGDQLQLETEFLNTAGEVADPPAALKAGFGGLVLAKRWQVPRAKSSVDQPNVVLVVMDTLRQDRLSAYGYERPTSPHLDKLAERGLVFENAYATASWTWPSTASIHTGKLPQEHGVFNERSCFLSESQITLAESLQAKGYTTAGFSANPLIVPGKNFDQGFEVFQHGKVSTRKGELVVPEALEWLDRIGDSRFFLYLHLADPHSPLVALPEARELLAPDVPTDFDPRQLDAYHWKMIEGCGRSETGAANVDVCVPESDRQHFSDLYDACVRSGDYWLGRVLDKLDALDLDERTVIAFTSDHGEDLFTYGFGTHGHTLQTALTKIPLILAGPGVPQGRVDALVSNRALAPTLAAVGQAELPGLSDPFDLRRAVVTPPEGPIYFSTAQGWWNGVHRTPILGVREEDLVLHYAPEGGDWPKLPPAEGGRWRLYDLESDPGEQNDLAAERAEQAGRMKQALMEHMEELEARRTTPAFEGGDGTFKMLKGIGYIGEDE